MKNAYRLIGVLAAAAIILSATWAVAQDSPQWRGANRDGKVAEFAAPEKWPAELAQKWKWGVGFGDSSPVLVGDKIYIFTRQGEDEVVMCLKADDGKQVWTDKNPAPTVGGAASGHPGPRATPVVADGKIVTLGVGGVVSCLDAAKGTVVWRKDPFPGSWPRFYTAFSPMVVDGMAIAHVGKEGAGAVIAFDMATGAEKWRWAGEGPAYSSPVLLTVEGTKQIVTMGEKDIVGLGAADGKLLWQIPFAPMGMAYNAATPIVDKDTVIYTGQGRGTKAVKVKKTADGWTTEQLWANAEAGTQFNSPVVKDGLLFGLTQQGKLFCLSAKDGKTAWADTVVRGAGRNTGYCGMLDVGAAITALPSTGELVFFKPVDTAYTELAKYKVSDGATFATPLISGNRIFVKDEQGLTCWTLGK